jgi:hypothetical protein
LENINSSENNKNYKNPALKRKPELETQLCPIQSLSALCCSMSPLFKRERNVQANGLAWEVVNGAARTVRPSTAGALNDVFLAGHPLPKYRQPSGSNNGESGTTTSAHTPPATNP